MINFQFARNYPQSPSIRIVPRYLADIDATFEPVISDGYPTARTVSATPSAQPPLAHTCDPKGGWNRSLGGLSCLSEVGRSRFSIRAAMPRQQSDGISMPF